MRKITFVKKIKSLIGSNNIYMAITSLIENLAEESDKNTAILFSSRWQELTTQVQNGTISNSTFWETRNKIVSDLMIFCESLEKKAIVDIKSTVQEKQDELIKVLIIRAEKTNHELKKYSNIPVIKKYSDRFNILHKQHIYELKKGNFISAHEILGQIHNLSTWLEVEKKGDKLKVNKILESLSVYAADPLSEYRNGVIEKTYLNGILPRVSDLDVKLNKVKKEDAEIEIAEFYYSSIINL